MQVRFIPFAVGSLIAAHFGFGASVALPIDCSTSLAGIAGQTSLQLDASSYRQRLLLILQELNLLIRKQYPELGIRKLDIRNMNHFRLPGRIPKTLESEILRLCRSHQFPLENAIPDFYTLIRQHLGPWPNALASAALDSHPIIRMEQLETFLQTIWNRGVMPTHFLLNGFDRSPAERAFVRDVTLSVFGTWISHFRIQHALERDFGTISKAVLFSLSVLPGVDIMALPRKWRWSQFRYSEAISDLIKNGVDLEESRFKQLDKQDPRLIAVNQKVGITGAMPMEYVLHSTRWYGSFEESVTAIKNGTNLGGLNPYALRQIFRRLHDAGHSVHSARAFMTPNAERDRIISEIVGKPVSGVSIPEAVRRAYGPGIERYDTWDRALVAADLDPWKERTSSWRRTDRQVVFDYRTQSQMIVSTANPEREAEKKNLIDLFEGVCQGLKERERAIATLLLDVGFTSRLENMDPNSIASAINAEHATAAINDGDYTVDFVAQPVTEAEVQKLLDWFRDQPAIVNYRQQAEGT